MAVRQAFQPVYTKGQTVTPAVAAAAITIGKGNKSLTLSNLGVNICYVRVSNSANGAADASVADYPIMAGSKETISKAQDDDTLSHISAAGTTLHVIPGEGE